MRVIIQRVTAASLSINGKIFSTIKMGLLVFVGIEDMDNSEDIKWLINKIINLRIFNDQQSIMNLSVKEINGEILIVSQFTLHASTKKGNRPSYIKASKPEVAIPIYEEFIQAMKDQSLLTIKTGVFGADMKIDLTNDGPITIFIDTKDKE